MKNKRIALFGGTFDPIHNGHTHVARYTLHNMALDQLVFIPAKRSPLKTTTPRVNDQHRLEMIRLATSDEPRFSIHTCDLDRPAPSYTLDTVRIIRAQQPDLKELFWLIGADAIEELIQWYRVNELLQECTLLPMLRGACNRPNFKELLPIIGDSGIKTLTQNIVETPEIPISSRAIRQRLADKENVSDMLHPQVAAYIHEHGLYSD